MFKKLYNLLLPNRQKTHLKASVKTNHPHNVISYKPIHWYSTYRNAAQNHKC